MELEHGTWELRLCDCRHTKGGLVSVSDRAVDHSLCDPPYAEHVHKNFRVGKKAPGVVSVAKDMGFDCITAKDRRFYGEHLARITICWITVFSDMESEHAWHLALVRKAAAEYVRFGFWDRCNTGTPQFTGDRPSGAGEAICIAHGKRPKGFGHMKWNGGGKDAIWRHKIVPHKRRRHVAEKPLSLMVELVRDFTNPGDLVCDPFAGSGTTGVACLKLGRRFLGWEGDPAAHALAAQRLRTTREQTELRIPAPKKKEHQLVLEGT